MGSLIGEHFVYFTDASCRHQGGNVGFVRFTLNVLCHLGGTAQRSFEHGVIKGSRACRLIS